MSLSDDPNIRRYLDSICKKVRSRKAHLEIRAELLHHIAESIARKVAGGLSHETAVEQALLELGASNEIGTAFNRVHPPFYLTAPFIAALALSLAVITSSSTLYFAHIGAERAHERFHDIVAKHEDRFLEDQDVLSREPFFDFPGTRSDAGPLLNSRVEWDDQSRSDPYREVNRTANLQLPDALYQQVSGWGKNWATHFRELQLDQDFNWMKQLHRFDHWDLFLSGPLAEIIDRDLQQTSWFSIPIPNYQHFQLWSKLRLMRAIRDRDLLPALKEVRQLSKLIYSNEIMIASIYSTVLLRIESQAYEFGLSHGLIGKNEWRPVPDETITRGYRAMYGYVQMFSPDNDPAMITRIFGGAEAQAGYCAAMGEGAVNSAHVKAFFLPHYPLEVDYGPNIELLDRLLRNSRSKCRLSYARKVWDDPGQIFRWYTDKAQDLRHRIIFGYLSQIPYLRQISTFVLLGLAVPDYMTGPYSRSRLPSES